MSANLSNCVWQVPLKSYQKLVLLALADYADERGWSYPSLTNLSRKCGISYSSVIENLKILIEKGLISKKRRCDDPCHQQTNLYKLNLSCLSETFFDAFFEIDCKQKNPAVVIVSVQSGSKHGKEGRKR